MWSKIHMLQTSLVYQLQIKSLIRICNKSVIPICESKILIGEIQAELIHVTNFQFLEQLHPPLDIYYMRFQDSVHTQSLHVDANFLEALYL